MSMEKTLELINFLQANDRQFAFYAYWQLDSYVKAFGMSDAAIVFTSWFYVRYGKEKAGIISNLSESIKHCWDSLKPAPLSILEAIDLYRIKHGFCPIKVVSDLAGDELVSPETIAALASITVPRTQEGIEAVAHEFRLNKATLLKILC